MDFTDAKPPDPQVIKGQSIERGSPAPVPQRRFLFVSPIYPADFDTAVFGIFKRMRILLDACKFACASLDLLFLTSEAHVAAAPPPGVLRSLFRERWGLDANVELVANRDRQANNWSTYLAPIADFSQHEDYWPYGGPLAVAAIERLSAHCDLLIAHRLGAMIPLLKARSTLPPVVFDLDDIEHVKLGRLLAAPSDWRGSKLLRLQLPALRRLERRAIRFAVRTLVCSEHDRLHLARQFGVDSIATLENAIDTAVEQSAARRRKRLLFIGAFSYRPNAEAAEFLVRSVWPLIRNELPDAQLIIAGSKPERIGIRNLATPGVEYAGFVPDLEALYRSIDAVCCPILTGGGTRIKILEAAAFGRPVAATTVGAEGLDFVPGSEILIADDAAGLARHCAQLLSQPERAAALGAAARAKVIARYGRGRAIEDAGAIYLDAMKSGD